MWQFANEYPSITLIIAIGVLITICSVAGSIAGAFRPVLQCNCSDDCYKNKGK